MNKIVKPKPPLKKVVMETAKSNKDMTLIALAWVLGQMDSAFGKLLPTLNGPMSWLYAHTIMWAPPNHNWDWVDFNILFWPIAGIAWLIRSAIKGYKKWRNPEKVITTPVVLYKNELAATMEVIDNETDAEKIEDAIDDFLLDVGKTIAANLRLSDKDYRMYFFVPRQDQKDRPDPEIDPSGIMLGKQFELVDKKKLPDNELAKLKSTVQADFNFLRHIVKTTKTDIISPDPVRDDVKVFLLGKNPGRIRLGIFIAVLKEDVEIAELEDMFPRVSHIISTIGFIDEMVDYVVNYGQDGGDVV